MPKATKNAGAGPAVPFPGVRPPGRAPTSARGTPPEVRMPGESLRIPVTDFRLLGGGYTDEFGNHWSYDKDKDTIIPSDKPLDELFPNAFEKLDGGTVPEAELRRKIDEGEAPSGTPVDEEGSPASDEEDTGEEEDLGEDVTEQFAGAEDLDLKVYHKDKNFNVVDVDEPDTPLNEKPFSKKADAEKFVKDYGKK